MAKKKKEEEKKRHNPTPNLGIPNSNRQMFTFSENKLLDQITVEITEAWAKDLVVIRKCQKATKAAVIDFQNIINLLKDKFENLDKCIGEDLFLLNMNEIIEKQKTMFQFMEEIRHKIVDKPKKWWQFWK